MKTEFRQSFLRDLKKVADPDVLKRIQRVIAEAEAARQLQGIRQLKKITGTNNYYRIRVGEYRIGIVLTEETIEFVRCLHRRELYRFFP